MATLPLGEVKTHPSELVGRVHDHHERVTVTVHGRPSAVLVAVADLERAGVSLARRGGLLLSQCKASPVGSCKRYVPPVVAHALSKMG
jgi:prevent-host-death family protein